MATNPVKRSHNVGQANGTAAMQVERAMSDGEFRCRPLWRVMRPDHHYGPKLTAAARRVMQREANHVDDHR